MTMEELTAKGNSGGGSRAVLFIGLILGVVAAVLIALVLSGGGDDDAPITVPATRIAVAATGDIPARTRLTRDMLEVKTYAIADVDADAFTSINQILNRVTSADVEAGQVITPSTVSATTGEGLTFTVSEGMRAVSIGVEEVVIAGGNISPDNRVDIVGVFSLLEGSDISNFIRVMTGQSLAEQFFATADSNVIFTLLQNVRVLAVAQDLPADAARPSGDSDAEGAILEESRANPKAATVTLEVTPQQAQVLAIADLHGTMRLSLRPFGEDEPAEVTPIIVVLE